MGIWRDKWDRACKVTPGWIGARAGFSRFLDAMVSQDATDGVFCVQCGTEIYYNIPESEDHQKWGYVGENPNTKWSGKIYEGEGITFKGFCGSINVIGGGWENACYKVKY